MSDKLNASPEQLRDFAKEAETHYNDIEGLVKKIWVGKMAATDTWEGGARIAFDNLMDRYASTAEKLNDKLLETSQNLLKTSDSFSEQDSIFRGQVEAKMAELDLPGI